MRISGLSSDVGSSDLWWDYRQAAFRRDLGLRIDLTLVSDALREQAVEAGIDREPRTWERPSDHTPAWVRLAMRLLPLPLPLPLLSASKDPTDRSDEHTSEIQSLLRTPYAVFCLNKT